MQISLLLEMAAESFPDRAMVSNGLAGPDGPILGGEVLARARAGAAWLAGQGGETLVFCGLNGPALPIALFAGAIAGMPFAPINYRLTDADLCRLLARTAPSVAIVDADIMPRVTGTPGVTLVTREAFEAACLDPANRAIELPESEQDIAVLLFTSGTTGEPKAAVLRHGNLSSYVVSTVEFMGAEEGEAALISVPPYHIAGMSAVLTGIYGGRRLVYLPAFTPEIWVDTAIAENVTHAMVVPTMLGRILDVLDARGITLPGLRALSYGGGRMPLPVIERALKLMPHVDFVNAYGLTETSSTVAVLGPDDHRAAISSEDVLVRARLGSVGRPLHTLELEIRCPDGKVLPARESGEIHVRGEQVAGEYLHKKLIGDDGWFATNDAGWLDEGGYLFIEGRLDDVIVRGGENISPGEIEDVLRAHPRVRDVAVLGLPDDQWGERVAAVLVCDGEQPAIAELTEWVKSRLRSTKTPETWEFRTELPYNETGKLLRRVLKSELTTTA
ncbi:long-chain fatty acid--CoA ligase (plasmid) [Sphingomonas paeninsulae]|uniref:Long-chain fatty acid--CoA ligase n=1 Tax=Sphingomonas paeninsulae TaxID=2319844 RepID=A0A494TI10_SPHPE|nr:class I adenylate-forming enzyme family protein [Sphingomonas paeninsulae]AYJ85068.1 long-chain fatty acid--CoA ligase [Sphingomonas paeninsulae]